MQNPAEGSTLSWFGGVSVLGTEEMSPSNSYSQTNERLSVRSRTLSQVEIVKSCHFLAILCQASMIEEAEMILLLLLARCL